MSRLSNKGQSLALFIVFVFFIILLGTYVIDISYAKYNKKRLDEITKMIIKYGLSNIEEDPFNDMVDLIYQNDSEIDNYNIQIDRENKIIKMSIDKSSPGLFGKITKKDIYNEKSSYQGYIKNEKMIIEKVIE